MIEKAQKLMLLVVAAGALAIGGAVVANAASDGSGSSGSGSGAQSQAPQPQRQDETELSGETADKVRAAALEEVPGGTIIRLETDSGPAAYEAHVRKPDGTAVIVLVNSGFEVTDVQEGRPGGRGGPGGRPCDKDGDGNPDRGSGSGSNGDQGTDFVVPGSSDQI